MLKDIWESFWQMSVITIIMYTIIWLVADLEKMLINPQYILWQAASLLCVWVMLFLMKQWDSRTKVPRANRYIDS